MGVACSLMLIARHELEESKEESEEVIRLLSLASQLLLPLQEPARFLSAGAATAPGTDSWRLPLGLWPIEQLMEFVSVQMAASKRGAAP